MHESKGNVFISVWQKLCSANFRILFPSWENNPERVPENGPLIICCNHVCMKDPIYLTFSPKRQIFYMAKKELFENKFVGKVLRALGAFAIERGAGDKESLSAAEKILKDGGALGILHRRNPL